MWGGPPPMMTPEQIMQMQSWMQMQQQMAIAGAMGGTPTAGQHLAQQPAPSPPAPFVVTNLVLVQSTKDGNLERVDGQRTSVPIKVALNDEKEPTGAYGTAESVRQKAAASFPEAGSEVGWKLFVGAMKDNQPFDVALAAGSSADAVDSSWRELFSCKVISGQEPVVFAQPCLVGHEARDVDRKRAASLTVEADAATAQAAVTVLTAAHPAKRGKGPSARDSTVVQLTEESRVVRLRERVQALVNKSKSAAYMDPHIGKSILILTDGKWVAPKRDKDNKIIAAGYYSEIQVESIDASFLDTDGNLEKEMLYFACRCPPCVHKAGAGAFARKPVGRAAAAGKEQAPPCSWYRSEVRMQSDGGHHSSKKRDGGIILVSLWAMVKDHMEKEHGGGFDLIEGNKAASTSQMFTLGSALLQTPAAQAELQAAAAAQSTAATQQPPPLTPADPPEPPPTVLRYPFDATADTDERKAAAIRMEDITTAKLAAGSMVSWRVFDLLRRYEEQCAISAGLSSELVLVMPPYDSLLIDRRMATFEKNNNVVIYLSTREGSTFPTFQLLEGLKTKVELSMFGSNTPPFLPFVAECLKPPLQFVSIPILSSVHYSEYIWLPQFDISFSFDSYPELHPLHIKRIHTFVQHVACSSIELVAPVVPHQPKDGAEKNVCAFSSTLFLQLTLKLLKEHGPTPLFVQALRGLTVDEREYHKYRKRAAKDINSLLREYGHRQQEARIAQRKKAKADEPGTSGV